MLFTKNCFAMWECDTRAGVFLLFKAFWKEVGCAVPLFLMGFDPHSFRIFRIRILHNHVFALLPNSAISMKTQYCWHETLLIGSGSWEFWFGFEKLVIEIGLGLLSYRCFCERHQKIPKLLITFSNQQLLLKC